MGVARLLSVTETLEAPRIYERSFKLTKKGIATDRGLVSMDRRALYPGPKSTLHEICTALGCPDPAPLDPYLGLVTAVHFGADGEIGKCYLEFAPQDRPEAGLVFLALKWKGMDQRLNRYNTMEDRSHEEKQQMIGALVPDPVVADVMQRSIDLAASHDPDGRAVVLLVTEDGSRRASLDISVADAKHTLARAAGVLAPLKAFQGCDLRPFLDEHGDASFGHIAAGVDRNGETFVTVYFGATPL